MTSYLIDGALFLALIITTWRVVAMYRQLQILSKNHADYQRIFDQTSDAMDQIGLSLQELKVSGEEIVNTLGKRIDEGRETVADLNHQIGKAQDEMETLRSYLGAAAGRGSRRPEPQRRPEARPAPQAPVHAPAGGAEEAPHYHIPAELGGDTDENGNKKQVKSVAEVFGAQSGNVTSAKAVSALDHQNLRVRKVSFGQTAGIRSVSYKDEDKTK